MALICNSYLVEILSLLHVLALCINPYSAEFLKIY